MLWGKQSHVEAELMTDRGQLKQGDGGGAHTKHAWRPRVPPQYIQTHRQKVRTWQTDNSD